MSEPATAINGETRRKIVEALGELTLQNISNSARADYFQAAFGGLENNFALLQADLDKLHVQVNEPQPVDLSKIDSNTLKVELRHRGFRFIDLVNAPPVGGEYPEFAGTPQPGDEHIGRSAVE